MNPMIPPLPPLEPTSAITREESMTRPLPGGEVGGAAGTMPEPGSELVDLFRSKLDAARLAPPSASHSHGPSALTEVVTQEDHAVATLRGDVDRFAGDAPLMSPQEAAAQSIKVQMQVSEMVGKLYVGEAVAQGTKGSVQTLMKNQ
ncbi:hypothetical protein [Paraburkholderia rhynchosiae]|uniref:Type III secretion protein HrpB2 n=1 Tax=Paraburkholderia rhynchosiae TaxID=487049 RepID=A0A2N7W5Z6_9BURK|nr:hypothetical protein [Paraburkholderia rhynchosiae]PMS24812.1 hypothetical protein C0Z16_30180 [Paraburkholderia rhynchosiae]CAB3725615.1 hypothetical protein LMG27174_05338 [Paraburkholderia rhynchosiae]